MGTTGAIRLASVVAGVLVIYRLLLVFLFLLGKFLADWVCSQGFVRSCYGFGVLAALRANYEI
jgi:hypothetical protein